MQKELKDILKKCIVNDERAQFELYQLCFDPLMKICCRFHHNREDAVALLNEGYLKILLGLKKFDFEQEFKPWISTIMIRVAIDQYRKTKNYRSTIELREDISDGAYSKDFWVYNPEIENLQLNEIFKILHSLPNLEKMVFNLYEMEGYNHREVAEMLEISVRSSKRYLKSAKSRLRDLIQKKMEIRKVI